MRDGKTFCAIIPARGGSKGLPNKNIFPVLGKPLIGWTLDAAQAAPSIDEIVVSSDCDAILEVAREAGVPALRRPGELATDTAPTAPVIAHVLEHLAGNGHRFDFLILLQPTSPLRRAEDIEAAISALLDIGADGLISVCEPEHSPAKAFSLDDQGYLVGLLSNMAPFLPRQQLPATYLANGAIYIAETKQFLATRSLLTSRTVPFLMDSSRSIDVDVLADIGRVEQCLMSDQSQ